MRFVSLDFETRSTVDLTVVGAHVYARHPMTRALCACYSFDHGHTVGRWRIWAGEPMPPDLADAVNDPACFIDAWNAAFERLIFKHVLKVPISLRRYRCTMVRARSMALPGRLELCARALGMPVRKLDSRIMLKWCRPLTDGGWAQDPQEYEELLHYCDHDVMAEAALGETLRDLTHVEWVDYWTNEEINDRGLPIDIVLAKAAQRYAKDELHDIRERLNIITKGRVTSPKQFQRIKEWLADYLPDELYETVFLTAKGEPREKVTFDAAMREDLLGDDNADILTGDAREFIELVHDGGRASTAKFAAMEARGVDEARVYGAFQFAGAGQTGRYSSQGVQFQNLIRDKLENIEDVVEGILRGVSKKQLQDIASYRSDGSFVFDKAKDRRIAEPYNMLTILSRTLKAAIIADDDKTFMWGDWKSIEAVVNPWLSIDQTPPEPGAPKETSAQDLLDYFASGRDIYRRQAALTYSVEETAVTPGQRQAGGKVPILSFGFGGGAGAIMRMARAYGITMDVDLAEMMKASWRLSNPWARRFWSDLEHAARQAILRPGKTERAGRVSYLCAQDALWCLLPSGRLLAYPYPRIELLPDQWGEEQETLTCMKGAFHPKKGTSEWPRMKLWGGILCENTTQATAACLLRWAIREMHDNGWPLIGHTHDEILMEIEADEAREAAAALRDVMTSGPTWAKGLPLLADISTGHVYGQGRELKFDKEGVPA